MTQSMRKTSALLAMLVACALCAAPAQAQVTGYPGKIICGFETGNVPLLNNANPFPHPYENFKPGNYATAFNVLNLNGASETVDFYLTIQNYAPVRVLSISVGPYTSIAVGCDEIFNPYIPPLVGQRFEGMLVPVAGNPNFVVDVVYTFESQNAFERHVVYGGGDPTTHTTLAGILEPFEVPTNPDGEVQAASGAGGLGLGASIDVVRLDPVSIPPEMADQATEELPPLEPFGSETGD